METALEDGWKALVEFDDTIAERDALRSRWREASREFMREAAALVELIEKSRR